MKKAKIMLTAIAAVAIVGGAMAFNAHRTSVTLYPDVNGVCTTSTTIITSAEDQGLGSFNYNTTSSAACPFTLFYAQEQ